MSLLLFLFSLFLSTVFFTPAVVAQEYTSTGYYYNNFDGNQLGTKVTTFGGAAFTIANTNLALGDGYSLSSTNAGLTGGYQFSFLPAGTNLNNEQFGYEWTMLYKNSGGNPDDSKVIDNGENSWRYWLFANNTNLADMQGYYLTQTGPNLQLRVRVSLYDDREVISYDLSAIGGNKKTYAIRLQRLVRGGDFVWQLFVDPYSIGMQQASTARSVITYNANIYNKYNYSGLEASSTSAGRFQFDELKLYSRKLEISGANDPANGFSSTLYDGQKDAVIYALKFRTRGLFTEIYEIEAEGSLVFANFIENPRLFSSKDSYFGNSDDVLINKKQGGSDFFAPTLDQKMLLAVGFQTQTFHSVGTIDGLLVDAGFLFFKADIKSDVSTNGVFSIKKLTRIGNYSASVNYTDPTKYPDVVGGGTTTPNSPSGKVIDWTGNTSNDWNVAANWSPTGVPGANDLARIGVSTFTSQPTVSSDKAVGNIIFGTEKVATLSVNSGATLTVNNSIEDSKGTTLAGTGTLTIKGTYLAKPTASADGITTANISNFNASNFVLNTKNKAVTVNLNGNQTSVASSVQSEGTSAATLTLASAATLTLNGANPSDFKASSNVVTLGNGSTVVYNANVPQMVNTLVPYKNIVFSGTGIKKIAGGTLTVLGNWTSSGGKVDLVANAADVDFTGATQSITDLGSDAGNGLVFKNVKFSGGGSKTLSATGKFAIGTGGYLTMSAGTILQTSGNLTLQASDLGTASVKSIPSNASIRGQVTVERYIKGGSKDMWRTYRMLGSPVYDNTTDFINTNTVGNRTYSFSQFIDDIIISGTGGAANGFDQTAFNQAGAWTYNNGYVATPNINTSVNIGRGAYLFYRGNRNDFNDKITSPFLNPESIIMTFKGILNQQSISVPLTHGSTSFSLVSNPYAATIDWNIVTKTSNVTKVVRVWNPSIRQYAVFNGTDGVNGGSRYIPTGQSFFVQTSNNSSPSITFTESDKYTPNSGIKQAPIMQLAQEGIQLNGKAMMASTQAVSSAEPARIRVKLQKDNTENTDETLIVLRDNEQAEFAADDVLRTGGEVVFLSSRSSDNKELAINYMPSISEVSSVPLSVNASANGNYSLNFELSDIPFGYEVKLKDNYLNTITTVNTSDTTYPLTINRSISASLGANRFEVMLAPQTTLPVVLTHFNANKTNEGVLVNWLISSATNHSHFVVQRAGDDLVYIDLESVPINSNGVYTFLDRTPLSGYNYYRLLQVDKDGKGIANEPIAVNFDLNTAATDGIFVYPTIVKTNFTLKYNGSLSSERYLVKITNVNGATVLQQEVGKSVILNGYNGELSAMAPSVYFVTLIDLSNGNKVGITKIIKQ